MAVKNSEAKLAKYRTKVLPRPVAEIEESISTLYESGVDMRIRLGSIYSRVRLLRDMLSLRSYAIPTPDQRERPNDVHHWRRLQQPIIDTVAGPKKRDRQAIMLGHLRDLILSEGLEAQVEELTGIMQQVELLWPAASTNHRELAKLDNVWEYV